MKQQTIKSIEGYSNIDGLIPGVRGQRLFPMPEFKRSDPFLLLIHSCPPGVNWHLVGKPLTEPVVLGGPFVMNTVEKIQQAKNDFQNGLFGEVR
ncbi:MAG: pirin-like C-terminal cupin domain-containing protein [Calditrichia bacterium]